MTLTKFCARCDGLSDHQTHRHFEAMAERRALSPAHLTDEEADLSLRIRVLEDSLFAPDGPCAELDYIPGDVRYGTVVPDEVREAILDEQRRTP